MTYEEKRMLAEAFRAAKVVELLAARFALLESQVEDVTEQNRRLMSIIQGNPSPPKKRRGRPPEHA